MAIRNEFSVQAGDDVNLTFDIDVNAGIGIAGAQVLFNVYAQEYGIPTGEALIAKDSEIDVETIVVLDSPPTITVTLTAAETVDLLHNYYVEVKVIDVNGNNSTVAVGIMCVNMTIIAPVTE